MDGGWQIPSRESSPGSTNCVTIIVVLGKIAHSDVKGNVSLCGRLNPEVFIDQVGQCCKLFKYIFHKECCYKEIAHFFVLSSEAILSNFVGFCGLHGSVCKSKKGCKVTQSQNPEQAVSISTPLFLICD